MKLRFILVLLRIPSSRPNPRTFSQFFRFQTSDFLAAENDGFWNVRSKIFFTSFLKFIPAKPHQNITDVIFTYP